MGSAPRTLGMIAAAALTGGLAACGTPGQSAHPAAARPPSAAAVPVRVQSDVTGWSGMVARPHVIYIGMGGAPIPGGWPGGTGGAPEHGRAARSTSTGPSQVPYPAGTRSPTRSRCAWRISGRTPASRPTGRWPIATSTAGVSAKSLHFAFSVQPGGSAQAGTQPGQERPEERPESPTAAASAGRLAAIHRLPQRRPQLRTTMPMRGVSDGGVRRSCLTLDRRITTRYAVCPSGPDRHPNYIGPPAWPPAPTEPASPAASGLRHPALPNSGRTSRQPGSAKKPIARRWGRDAIPAVFR